MRTSRAARSEAAAAAVRGREVAHKRVRTARSLVSAAAIRWQVEESQRTLRAAQCQQDLVQMQMARSAQPDAQWIAQRNLATSQRAMARSRTPVLGTLEQDLTIPAAVPSAAGKVSSCIALNAHLCQHKQ